MLQLIPLQPTLGEKPAGYGQTGASSGWRRLTGGYPGEPERSEDL